MPVCEGFLWTVCSTIWLVWVSFLPLALITQALLCSALSQGDVAVWFLGHGGQWVEVGSLLWHGIVLDDAQRSLPAPTVLGLCEVIWYF